jgi:hypothetical protein
MLLLLNSTYKPLTNTHISVNLFRKINLSTCVCVGLASEQTKSSRVYMTDLSGPQILDRIFSIIYIYIYWNLLLLVITRFLIYSTPSLLWLAFTQLFIIALKKKKKMFDRPTGFRTAIHREKHALLYILDRYCTHATDKEKIIYNIIYIKYIHIYKSIICSANRPVFVQNRVLSITRGQFSTFIVGTYNTTSYFEISNPVTAVVD